MWILAVILLAIPPLVYFFLKTYFVNLIIKRLSFNMLDYSRKEKGQERSEYLDTCWLTEQNLLKRRVLNKLKLAKITTPMQAEIYFKEGQVVKREISSDEVINVLDSLISEPTAMVKLKTKWEDRKLINLICFDSPNIFNDIKDEQCHKVNIIIDAIKLLTEEQVLEIHEMEALEMLLGARRKKLKNS